MDFFSFEKIKKKEGRKEENEIKLTSDNFGYTRNIC